ncbi:unnamed protein product [Ascophyllum nodosum]
MWETSAPSSRCSFSASTSTPSTLCSSPTTQAGYTTFKGTVLQGSELTTLVEGLEANDLLDGYTHMLTGYIGSPSFLRAVIDVHRRLSDANPGLVYICDPVLGDEGRLYVPAENVDIYRNEVLPLATMITPNQFEAELLSGQTIVTEEDAIRACRILHSRGPDTVVITSSRIDGLSGEGDRDDIVLFASVRRPCCHREVEVAAAAAAVEPFPPTSEAPPPGSRDDQAGIGDSEGPRVGEPRGGGNGVRPSRACQREGAGEGNEADVGDRTATGTSGGGVGSPEGGGAGEDAAWAEEIADDVFDLYRIAFPRLPQRFTGTGDLAAALLLAWTHKLPGDLAGALERVAGSMRAVLTRTHSQGSSGELLLVQSKEDIEHPPLELRVVALASER